MRTFSDVTSTFEDITSQLHLGDGPDLRRWGWGVAGAGVAAQLIGVVASAYAGDPAAANSGGVRDTIHASHALLLAGLAATLLGAALALAGKPLYGPRAGRTGPARRLLRIGAPIVAAVLVAAAVAAVQRAVVDGGPVAPAQASAASSQPAALPSTPAGPANADEFGENQPDQPLDAATRAKLASQLTIARQVALQYPTLADARRAGMILAGGFAPGSGTHMLWFPGTSKGIQANGEVDPRYPGSFIYDGTSPTSRIVGLMYLSLTADPPAGFAGPNDHWHRHFNTCIKFAAGVVQVPFPADSDVTQAQCTAAGGEFMATTVWMVHVWVVPGWESPLGVFSHANPDLRCADGTFNTDSRGFCQGT